MTRKYAYLIYYAVDEAEQEIVILNVMHPARMGTRKMRDAGPGQTAAFLKIMV